MWSESIITKCIAKDNLPFWSPEIRFQDALAWQTCIQWCLHRFGNTCDTWDFVHYPDLFGPQVGRFIFLKHEDLVEFMLVWN